MFVKSAVQHVVLNGRVSIVHFLVVQNLESECTSHGYGKIQVFISEIVVPVKVMFRNTIAQNLPVFISGICCQVIINSRNISFSIFLKTFHNPFAFCRKTYGFKSVKIAHGVADFYPVGSCLNRFSRMSCGKPVG